MRNSLVSPFSDFFMHTARAQECRVHWRFLPCVMRIIFLQKNSWKVMRSFLNHLRWTRRVWNKYLSGSKRRKSTVKKTRPFVFLIDFYSQNAINLGHWTRHWSIFHNFRLRILFSIPPCINFFCWNHPYLSLYSLEMTLFLPHFFTKECSRVFCFCISFFFLFFGCMKRHADNHFTRDLGSSHWYRTWLDPSVPSRLFQLFSKLRRG